MVAASTTECGECSAAAKYTCPACGVRTCSLACTKAHKTDTAKHPCGSSAATHANGPSTSSVAKKDASTTGGYVSMSEYGETHMMQDYLFLSAISRTTAEAGRRIVDMKLLPPSAAAAGAGGNESRAAAGPTQQRGMTNAQRQREQLLKQLHYRRLRVMVLPDGMARRKRNQSGFNPKSKRFELSALLRLPLHLDAHAKGKAKADAHEAAQNGNDERESEGWMVHRQDAERNVADVVLAELERRSFASRKETLKAKDALGVAHKSWLVAVTVLETARLVVPSARRCAWADQQWVALDAWPSEWVVHVPAYSARLTNESTTRYLDWWTRKRRWEEANPELAAEQKLQASRPRHDSPPSAPQPEPLEPRIMEPPVGEGIVSGSLLSMLSQRLGRAPPEAGPASPAPAQEVEPKEEDKAAQAITARICAPDTMTLTALLEQLPEGYAVVEFPELRVVPTAHPAPHAVDLTPRQQPATQQHAQPRATRAVAVGAKPLGALLASYDSDSNDDDGDDDHTHAQPDAHTDKFETHDWEGGASLAALASVHGFVQPTS
ncbi:uncharacterized protein PAN0_004d2138 [Moesziomyces antarcticus]|uniref:Uncharacterized protein n=2 Tax=Pseudozyma antarctica TaxID=84753 RepID=A0A081CB83_PSEA2|nr:uncharacterized protein PAN0_004d2138 [Moesziomyces antarcticus]GAK63929.1 conserved hypothetical protein [Moesziomyces antarcticus]SPO44860.1 uncharacterized protein PSANT_02546 [Moesziomyces antarcticus]